MSKLNIFRLLIICGIFNINPIFAHTYYVSTTGDDTQDGSISHPWQSLQKAANTLVAGDTVYVMAGTYMPVQAIEPANSGTETQKIHYSAFPGDEHLVVIDGTNIPSANWYGIIYVSHKSYLKFSGLSLINAGFAGILVENSHHIDLINNHTFQTYSSGISVWDSHHVSIKENEISRACWPSDGIQECISISGSQYVNVAENHVLDGGSLNFGGGGEGIDIKDGCSSVIVHHNHIENIASVGIYVDAYAHNQSDIQVYDNSIDRIIGVGIAVASEEGGELQNVLVQRNTVANCTDRAMVIHWTNKPDYVIQNIYVQHNTFANNNEGLDVGAHALGKNIRIINNIFSQNGLYQLQNSSNDLPANELIISHNLFDGDNPSWALLGNYYLTGNPQFTDSTTNNFNLEASSPAIDQGKFLTYTTSAGTGNSISVLDTGYFSDAYGMASGDRIRLQGENISRQILSIDSAQKTLTFSDTFSWNNQTNISQTYAGNAPDIGAHEFDDSNTIYTEKPAHHQIFPNPAQDNLQVPVNIHCKFYRIVSPEGSLWQSGILENHLIRIEKLPKGVYLLTLFDKTTGYKNTQKFVKN